MPRSAHSPNRGPSVADAPLSPEALRDHEWPKKDYSRITALLQDVCQEFHLGIGGEDTCELVCGEARRLRAAFQEIREPLVNALRHGKSGADARMRLNAILSDAMSAPSYPGARDPILTD